MTEQQEQINLIKWTQQPSIRGKYPALKYLFHIANERPDKIQAANLKKMGVKPGVPDLFLPVAKGHYHGLWIEMKKAGGRASADQIWWLGHLESEGYACRVCYSWEEGAEVLEWYLKLA